jgi:hypothetical protein
MPKKILLQTTIEFTEDDWHIGRFSMLRDHLRSLGDLEGQPLYDVTTRDRQMNSSGDDVVLSSLDQTDFDQLWLFAVDLGDGLSKEDCRGITRFRQRGKGIYSTRDHQDLGSSLCTLGGVGDAHFFHTRHPDPDESRRRRDDPHTITIDHPNYHSGANGDFQNITPVGEIHELLKRQDGTPLQYFPAHPHEGGVGVPLGGDGSSRVIATGRSAVTDRDFNLVVAFEKRVDTHGNTLGRAVADSSFHHLLDYNWDIDAGCPTFVEEPPGSGYKQNPAALNDIKRHVENLAAWL